MTASCSGCTAALGPRNKSGLCRPCVAKRVSSDPAVNSRRSASLKAHFADPANRAERAELCRAIAAKISPADRAARVARGKTLAHLLRTANASMSPTARAENGRKRSDTVLAWCPPEWRAKYRDLKKRGRRAADARAIVEGLIAGRPEPILYAQQKSKLAWLPPARRDEYDRLVKSMGAAEARRIIEADLSPFERQLARVAAGAKLTTSFRPTTTDHPMTLGGIASGLL